MRKRRLRWCVDSALAVVAVTVAGCATDEERPPPATTAAAALNTVPPEPPAIPRDVHLIAGGRFTRPAIPPLRTSLDGRVAVEMTKQHDPANGGALSVAFSLFVPEALTTHWASASNGVSVLTALPTYVGVELIYGHPFATVDTSAFDHRTLCDGWAIDPGDPYDANDPTDAFDPYYPAPPPAANPYPCADDATKDCYDLTVVSDYEDRPVAGGPKLHQLSGKPVRVVVASPKTAAGHIDAVITDPALLGTDPGHTGTDVRYGDWFDVDFMLEPMITRDGHLLVMRLGDSDLTWDNPETAAADPIVVNTEIVYAVAPATAPRCDVTAWTQLQPITHAHHDLVNQMPARYGFARYPLRDAEGATIADGTDLGGSYPWIDRDGDNLFFTLLSSTYFYDDPTDEVPGMPGQPSPQTRKRFGGDQCVDDTPPGPANPACTDPAVVTQITDIEEDHQFRGFAFAGLWSHGKTILFDNITNNTDFGLGREDRDQRKLKLFRDAAGNDVRWRVGTGRDNSGAAIPPGATQNSTFIDSWEQLFNHDAHLIPATVRDVVWIVNTGKASTEVAFDDYLDAEAIIVSEMTGSWSHAPPAGWLTNQGTYHDGFTQTGFHAGTGYDAEVRVQNAATTTAPIEPVGGPLATHPASIAEAWVVPPYGVVENGARIEPAALGGITGKGLWLDGTDDLVRYDMDPQPGEPSGWYLGLFVDPRFGNDGTPRVLARFPGGARLELVGLTTIRITPAAGAAVSRTLAVPLVQGAFSHLGLVVSNAGKRVDVLVNGYPLTTMQAATRLVSLLGPTVNDELLVGGDRDAATSNFKGWIDELKVLAYVPNAEVMCNHAHGTLIQLDTGAGPVHDAMASQATGYPSAAHDAVADQVGIAHGPQFVCRHDYTVDAEDFALLAGIPAGDRSVRDDILLSGPLVWNLERPDSHTNPFCLNCHKSGNGQPLGLEALELYPGVWMSADDRRQPMQPPQWIFGNIPATYFDFFGSGRVPPAQAPPAGENTDPYVYPP